MKENTYQQVADCLIEDMDGDLLLYNPATVETLQLNDSSAFVWQSCDGRCSVADIIGEAQVAFPQQAAQIEEDIISVVEDLVKRKVLQPVS